jgi:hypothetical protein
MSFSLSWRISRAGLPAHSSPLRTTLPGPTTAPAAMKALASTVAPSRMIAPMPIRQ